MPQAWTPLTGPVRRITAAVSAALLTFTLVVALPVIAPSEADTAHAVVDQCGVDVLFVLDESGSMEGTGETAVRTGVKAFIDELKADAPDSRMGIVEFNTTSRKPFGNDWKNVVSDETQLKNYIDDIGSPGYEAGGWTNWEDAMGDALSFTQANSDKPDYVVVITDGNPTTHIGNLTPDAGNSAPIPGSNPADNATMWEFASYEAVDEYAALSGLISGSDTIIGFGAGSAFGDAATRTRLSRMVDEVTTISPLSALAEAIGNLAAEVCAPSLSIEKSTNGVDADTPTGPTVPAGSTVTWEYVVTNDGPVTVYDISVTDDNNDGATISCPNTNGSFDLDPGQSETCTASSVSWFARDHQQHSNTATALGSDADQNDASDTDPSHYQPTLNCPFDATGDRIVIDIFDLDPSGNGGFLLNRNSEIGPLAVSVPAGHYNVMWSSYDAHAAKNEANPGQTQEVWYASFPGGSTSDTLDLPWNQDYIQGTFPGILSLGSAQTELTIKHGAADSSTNSIHAICVALDPIDPADIGVTKTLLTSDALYDGDSATFEVEIANNSSDEKLTVTSLTENIGGSNLDLLLASPGAPVTGNTCDDVFPGTVIDPSSSESCQFTITVAAGMTSASDERCDEDQKIDVVEASGVGAMTGEQSSADDCEDITINPDPTIVVEKTDSGSGVYYSGDQVTYTVKITNGSDTESITIDALTDNVGDGVINLLATPTDADLASNTCNANPTISISAGGTFECSFSIVVDADMASASHDSCPDVDTIVDVVAASGTGDDSDAAVAGDDCEDITVNDKPAISVTKTLADDTPIYAGGDATFDVVIRNLSTTEAVTIDTLTEDVGNGPLDLMSSTGFVANTCTDLAPNVVLDPGETASCSFTITVDDSYVGTDHDSCTDGGLVDVVAASGVGTQGQDPVSDDDCETVTIAEEPSITVLKTVDDSEPSAVPGSGAWVTYNVSIANGSSSESVTVSSLTDTVNGETIDLLAADGSHPDVQNNSCNDASPFTVPADGSVDCSFDYWVDGQTTSASDDRCDDGQVVDVVAASVVGTDSGVSSDGDDCAEINVRPDISVTKSTVNLTIPVPGFDVPFDVTVTNNTIHDVTLISLLDSVDGGPDYDITDPGQVISTTCEVGITIPGGSSYECSFTVRVSGAAGDIVTDVVEAVACDANQACDVDDDFENVRLKDVSIAVDKTAEPSQLIGMGDVTWTVVVTNDGDWPLVNIQAFDTVSSGAGDMNLTACEDLYTDEAMTSPYVGASLDPGESLYTTCESSHDISTDGPDVTNHVTVVGDAAHTGGETGDPTGFPVGCDDTGLPEHDVCAADDAPVTILPLTADGELGIDKKVLDPSSGIYVDLANLPSSTAFPATVEWQLTVENLTEHRVEEVYFLDANAPACEVAFSAAMDAIESGKDFLDPFESVVFTCESQILSVPAINTGVAGGQDVLGRALPEVSDDAAVVQVLASATIGDTVWYDDNGNGVQDGAEAGIAGTPVTLTALDGQDVDPVTPGVQTTMTLITDANGKYLFSGLPDGRYRVNVALSSVPNPGTLALRFTTASSFTVDLPDGGSFLDADFGVVADELPTTGLDTDSLSIIAILLLVAGSIAVLATRREDEIGDQSEAA